MNKKITREQAQSIIDRVAAGERQKNLAAEFHMSPAAISKIIRGKTWPDLKRPEHVPKARTSKVQAADIPVIRRRLQARENPAAIAADYGVCRQTIINIREGRSWAHITVEKPPKRRRRVWEQ